MNSETRNCQNCKNDFVIEPDDFGFYEKIGVPAPTWCPTCRFQRRLSFLNWHSLYKRKCDKCGDSMVSVHNEDKPFKVYCNTCYWKDDWDGTEYAMDYDPNRNFFEQVLELRNKSTYMGQEVLHSTMVNTPYANAAAYQKDCFMVFNADYGERCVYSNSYVHLTECMDVFQSGSSELCYECVGLYKCFKCIYSENLESCSNILFSKNLSGCTDCFGCMNLRNKNYCIFNEQYSREEYFEKIKEFNLDTNLGLKNALEISRKFWKTQPYRATIGNSMNVNTTGDIVYESRNTKNAYIVNNVEDSKFVQMMTMSPVKDCYDYTIWGNGAEKLYECLTVGEGGYNTHFSAQCWPAAIENEYCMYTIGSKNCFGCVNLKRKENCILNKEYTKDEYDKLRKQILSDLENNPYVDKNGRVWKYGEFLPIDLSSYSYNETVANVIFPQDKFTAINQGYSWHDTKENDYTATLANQDIPEKIVDTPDTILNEIMICNICNNAYKINELELYLLRKLNLPIPHNCWKCRQTRRFNTINPPMLYDRNCAKCDNVMVTSYAPNRPEIVYCEKCYQQEII